jgi:hypothetical protein
MITISMDQLEGRDSAVGSPSRTDMTSNLASSPKPCRGAIENHNKTTTAQVLDKYDAVSVIAYDHESPNIHANDIWPNYRSSTKLPARYLVLDRVSRIPDTSLVARKEQLDGKPKTNAQSLDSKSGRPIWKLPPELVEHITSYLNRDDVKSLRLVSRELDHIASQVIFRTVVVPFNTEIYGMLGPAPKPDMKGKKRATIDRHDYLWKNTNGDDLYDGHGLDVFRGFGKHITRYGMSFEVSEDLLACPPYKSPMEHKASFWGTYDWPFDEYRRFDEVAGLEDAADETPRMTVAFSELSKVKELALSIDSGLGWLNGPDRSIRARILQKPPAVFGTLKDIPDRPAQAQEELWRHIEACHTAAGKDIMQATLYKIEGSQSLFEPLETGSLVSAEHQPSMPYLAPHIIRHSTPHNHTEFNTPAPSSLGDSETLERFLQPPISSGSGVLFSSSLKPGDPGHIISPIIPSNLTKAQKEWLMETEWAQRAFLSSYMLSIVDNPVTFGPVHTLTISRLPGHYLPMLDRPDFWEALPTLKDVTLMVIPSWRTVNKDEAGFVTTPNVSPLASIDSFCGLLLRHIVFRSNIKNLTFGWASGGEHAEGIYARNRLIMPAPLMLGLIPDDTTTSSTKVAEKDPVQLQASLLRFPHVERLTLKNCWVTPHIFLQFVKIHDVFSLRHLVLDSVSITPVLQLSGNQVLQPAPQPNSFFSIPSEAAGLPIIPGINLQGGIIQGNNGVANSGPMTSTQFMGMYIRSLRDQLHQLNTDTTGAQHQAQITVIQNHLQRLLQMTQTQNHTNLQNLPMSVINQAAALANQVQSIQQQVAAATAAAPPVTVQTNSQLPAASLSILQNEPRGGSWLHIIDIISPGLNLSDFDNPHSKADPHRRTSLECIEFVSCGYVELPRAAYSHNGIGVASTLGQYTLWKRRDALAPAMLNSWIPHLGQIIQEVDLVEYATLDAGWNLKHGWDDAEEARAVEFDGLLPGGTGRFSNKIQRSDRLAGCSSSG